MSQEQNQMQKTEGKSLVKKFASRYSVEPDKLLSTLKQTAFRVKGGEVTNAQMMALLIVADQYHLNPFTKEIYAFPDKQNGIVPVVGVDGWSRLINENPDNDGIEFRSSENMGKIDEDAKDAPEWMDVIIHRKDREHPTIIREYLDEVYRPAFRGKDNYKSLGPWQTHTKRMLRHKTLIQGARIAFGLVGIYDEDEAERIVEGEVIEHDDFQSDTTRAINESVTGQQRERATGDKNETRDPGQFMEMIDKAQTLDILEEIKEMAQKELTEDEAGPVINKLNARFEELVAAEDVEV